MSVILCEIDLALTDATRRHESGRSDAPLVGAGDGLGLGEESSEVTVDKEESDRSEFTEILLPVGFEADGKGSAAEPEGTAV